MTERPILVATTNLVTAGKRREHYHDALKEAEKEVKHRWQTILDMPITNDEAIAAVMRDYFQSKEKMVKARSEYGKALDSFDRAETKVRNLVFPPVEGTPHE